MHKYEIIIYWSDEDQLYLAEVPDLPGCITHGDTYNTALANVEEAIQLWVDTAEEFGNPIPRPRGRRTVSSRAESMSKGKNHTGRIRTKRRNNPHVTLSEGRSSARMNPKAH